MKKMFTILILTVLVLSMIPAAFAQEEKIYTTMLEEPVEADEEPGVETEESEPQTLPARATLEKAREIAKEKMEQARVRYQEAKERYQTAKERYTQAKSKVREVKGVIAKCREEDESKRCVQARSQIKVHSKDFLSTTADKIVNVLEKLRAKVEANEDLTEEQAAEMIADIDAKIAEIQAAKESAETLTNASTKQEIQEAARVLKQEWVKTRVVAKRNAGRLVNEKIGGILVQAEKVEIKLDRIIEKLRSEGYEIHGIEAIYADFDDELGKARENYEKARELYESDVEPGEVDEMMKQANKYMREAHKYIKYAHNMLRNLVVNIKGLQDGQRLLETPVDEEEEELEEEEEPEEVEEEELEDEEEIELKKVQCKESDDGRDYTEKGTACIGNTCKTDYCFDDDSVTEYYLEEEGIITNEYCHPLTDIFSVVYPCSEGCKDGACIGEVGELPPVVTEIQPNATVVETEPNATVVIVGPEE